MAKFSTNMITDEMDAAWKREAKLKEMFPQTIKPKKKSKKKRICLDFDGVIHLETSGWHEFAKDMDPPVPGVREAIKKLREKYEVYVFSARCADHHPNGVSSIEEYLEIHDMAVDKVSLYKPGAEVYVDDRGLQFKGDWTQTLDDIENFVHWQGRSTN